MKEGSCSSEEHQGKTAGARERQDSSDSSLKKLYVIGKKIIGSRIADLVKKDEPDDCHVYYEDQITPHCSTTYEQICKSVPKCHTTGVAHQL